MPALPRRRFGPFRPYAGMVAQSFENLSPFGLTRAFPLPASPGKGNARVLCSNVAENARHALFFLSYWAKVPQAYDGLLNLAASLPVGVDVDQTPTTLRSLALTTESVAPITSQPPTTNKPHAVQNLSESIDPRQQPLIPVPILLVAIGLSRFTPRYGTLPILPAVSPSLDE